jgi:hypothetical protein
MLEKKERNRKEMRRKTERGNNAGKEKRREEKVQ